MPLAAMMIAGAGHAVELPGVADVAHVLHQREVEQRGGALDQVLVAVEEVGVQPEDGGGVDREGAVHEDRDAGDLPAAEELVQAVHQLLGAAHGKGGDQDLPAAARHLAHDVAQARLGVGDGLVGAVGVGGLDDQRVHGAGRRVGVADDGEPGPADVAGEDQPVGGALGDAEVHRGGAEDVAGVGELEGDVLAQVLHPAVGQPQHEVLHRHRVGQGVQRLALRPDLLPARQELGVLLLDVRRVGEHHGGEVAGGGGGVDGAVEAAPHQQRQPPRVVDVGVGEDHAVEGAGGRSGGWR
jgi:hypothetical protein